MADYEIDLERGESVQITMGEDVFHMERRPRKSDWEVGDVVHDREKDSDDEMLVVNVSNRAVSNVNIGGLNVAEANENYPSDDTCVFVIYKETLLNSIDEIPDDLGMFFKDDKFRVLGVKAYGFPSTRLVSANE